LRPSGSSFPDKIRLHPRYPFCGRSRSSLRLHMATNFRNWSREGVIEQKERSREEKKNRWQEWKQVGTKKCPLAQVRHHEPKTGLWWPHFAVWPKQRIHCVSIKSADRTNTCSVLPIRLASYVSCGRTR
jgi:hypothetical protein